MATRRKPRPTAFETFVNKNYDDLVCEYAETGAESEGVDFDDFAEEAYARSKKKKGAKRRPNPGGGADLLQEFATKIRVSDNFSRLDLSLSAAALMLADFALRSLGPLVTHETGLTWAAKALRDHTPVTDPASASKGIESAHRVAHGVLSRLTSYPRDPLYIAAIRAIGEVCYTAKHKPTETPSACVEAMEKTIAAGVSEEKVTNAARRFLGQALHPPAARTEFVAAAPRSSLFGSFRSMFSSSPSARAANPASLYSVAVDGRPVYSSHLRDQAMQRFMQKRSSGHGEVTLSIDGDVAYRAASGGSVRVGNPKELDALELAARKIVGNAYEACGNLRQLKGDVDDMEAGTKSFSYVFLDIGAMAAAGYAKQASDGALAAEMAIHAARDAGAPVSREVKDLAFDAQVKAQRAALCAQNLRMDVKENRTRLGDLEGLMEKMTECYHACREVFVVGQELRRARD